MASSTPMLTFTFFPEDVQLNILSFLSPADISSFACTSRRFASLCSSSSSSDLWLSMCLRRWGSKTLIRSWAGGGGQLPFSRLYMALDRWEHLIGFWRRIGDGFPLVFFEWGPSFITGSRISPSPDSASYAVLKIPFLWIGLSRHGEPVSFIHPGSRFESLPDNFFELASGDSDLLPVTISFIGRNNFVVEENGVFCVDSRGDDLRVSEEVAGLESSSPPDVRMSEIYKYFANRTSPSGEKGWRRQRKKKEKERFGGRRGWENEHFVKIVHCCPTPARPLQGLWKVLASLSLSLSLSLLLFNFGKNW